MFVALYSTHSVQLANEVGKASAVQYRAQYLVWFIVRVSCAGGLEFNLGYAISYTTLQASRAPPL